jgi:hypothetical protein
VQLVEQVSELLESKFPLPFVLVLLGYTFILLIDKVLIDAHDSRISAASQLSKEDKSAEIEKPKQENVAKDL